MEERTYDGRKRNPARILLILSALCLLGIRAGQHLELTPDRLYGASRSLADSIFPVVPVYDDEGRCTEASSPVRDSETFREMRRVWASMSVMTDEVPTQEVPDIRKSPSERNESAKSAFDSPENFEQIPDVWERIWFKENPDFVSPYRTPGQVI